MASSDSLDSQSSQPMLQTLMDMQVNFSEKAVAYHRVEKKWRKAAFRVAVSLGVLPVMTGVTQLMPEVIRPWLVLGIAVTNVIVVVVNVKMDLGERIADASMAAKGFDKIATQIDLFFCHLNCTPEQANAAELLIKIRAVVESIETNLSYPEQPKARNYSAVVPCSSSDIPSASQRPSLSAMLPSLSGCLNRSFAEDAAPRDDCERAYKWPGVAGQGNSQAGSCNSSESASALGSSSTVASSSELPKDTAAYAPEKISSATPRPRAPPNVPATPPPAPPAPPIEMQCKSEDERWNGSLTGRGSADNVTTDPRDFNVTAAIVHHGGA